MPRRRSKNGEKQTVVLVENEQQTVDDDQNPK